MYGVNDGFTAAFLPRFARVIDIVFAGPFQGGKGIRSLLAQVAQGNGGCAAGTQYFFSS